jgi:exopolyphosphatase/pppGpp-phosphohydrolase
MIADEAVAIYEAVKEQVDANQTELKGMEEAVKEQLSGKPKKKKKKKKIASKKGSAASGDGGTMGTVGGVEVNLGDLDFKFDDIGSDSDGSGGGLLDL